MASSQLPPAQGNNTEPSASHPIVRRATVGSEPTRDLNPNSIAGRPRRKSITIACERCRRRKIRCDGDQPCATCARFSVACIRPSKHKEKFGPEAQALLEERVRNLERQLQQTKQNAGMDLTASPVGLEMDHDFYSTSGWPDIGDSANSGSRQLRLDTNFSMPPRSFSFDDDQIGSRQSNNSLASPDIPTIEITSYGCETPHSRPMSPSPSLLSQSATSRASTPDPYSVSTPGLMSQLIPGKHDASVSPPISPYQPHAWDFATGEDYTTYLSPPTGAMQGSSRRSSISSLGLNDDLSSMNLTFPDFHDMTQAFDQPVTNFNNMYFPAPTSSPQPQAQTQPVMPSKQDAQNLSTVFFDQADRNGFNLPIEPLTFNVCLEAVYSLSDFNSPINEDASRILNGYSLGMAKFQVFLVLTTAYKLFGKSSANALTAEHLYRLAMAQTFSSRFWTEDGGPEMASLLGVYAHITKSNLI